jgi:hypothetical protein
MDVGTKQRRCYLACPFALTLRADGFCPRHFSHWARRGKIRQLQLQEEMMKPLVLCLAMVLAFCVTDALAQRSKINLANTTWTIYYKECPVEGKVKKGNWEKHMTITFLSGGKIKNSDDGIWKLTGNKLYVNAPDSLVIVEMKVTITGSQMNGNACLSMTCRENFCVRLVKN